MTIAFQLLTALAVSIRSGPEVADIAKFQCSTETGALKA